MLTAWVFVFGINLAVPLIFSSSMTDEHGKLGMFIAIVSLLACGCFACAVRRVFADALIIGGVVVGLLQIFPVLQILAGMFGMAAGSALGLADFGDDGRPPSLANELRWISRRHALIARSCISGRPRTAPCWAGQFAWIVVRRRKTARWSRPVEDS